MGSGLRRELHGEPVEPSAERYSDELARGPIRLSVCYPLLQSPRPCVPRALPQNRDGRQTEYRVWAISVV